MGATQYLCDLPGFGGVFCVIDEDMTVSHLLALVLAVFTVAAPIMIWSAVLDEHIHEDPRASARQPDEPRQGWSGRTRLSGRCAAPRLSPRAARLRRS